MDNLSIDLKSQQSMQPDPRRAAVKAAVKSICSGTTTDKEFCGTDCRAEPASSVLGGASITLYTCMPTKTAASSVQTVTVIHTSIVKTWLTTFPSTPATTTQPKLTALTINTMAMATCGGTASALSACPTQCPASAIPGGVGVIYSCLDPANILSASSTPTTAESSRRTFVLTTAASTTSTVTSASTPNPLTSVTVEISTFETSFSPAVTANDPTLTKDPSTSSTLSTVKNHVEFQQTSAGKVTIALSLVAGLVIIGLAIYLCRRHKRMIQARDRSWPEAVQLRSDTGASSSDGIPETRRNLSLWEVLTNTTREEYHAKQASELRQVDRAAMTARYYRNRLSHADG